MRIIFWASDKPHERLLADAFAHGARIHGDDVQVKPLTPEANVEDCDVACMVGVKSNELFWAHWNAKIHIVYFDKGYDRHAAPGPVKVWEYWRVSVDAHQPTRMLERMSYSSDRLERLAWKFKPWRAKGEHVVFAGSSQKYHTFYGLSEPTKFARKVVESIQAQCKREIVYRPKPSWKEAVPIPGTRFSQRPRNIEDELEGAHCLVTHGSNACFEAILVGVPCIILGEAVARSISSHDVQDIENIRLATEEARVQWLSNLAYCQWTQRELASGEAWQHVRPHIYG
jgi:hypothetical protein